MNVGTVSIIADNVPKDALSVLEDVLVPSIMARSVVSIGWMAGMIRGPSRRLPSQYQNLNLIQPFYSRHDVQKRDLLIDHRRL